MFESSFCLELCIYLFLEYMNSKTCDIRYHDIPERREARWEGLTAFITYEMSALGVSYTWQGNFVTKQLLGCNSLIFAAFLYML